MPIDPTWKDLNHKMPAPPCPAPLGSGFGSGPRSGQCVDWPPLDRVHFWIREEQPKFSYSSYSPGTPCKILDPKDQNSKTVNHFEFEGKLKKNHQRRHDDTCRVQLSTGCIWNQAGNPKYFYSNSQNLIHKICPISILIFIFFCNNSFVIWLIFWIGYVHSIR